MTEKQSKWVLINKEKVVNSTGKLNKLVHANPTHFKTKNLGTSLDNYSNQMERDISGKRRRNRTFEYGSLIYVNFGINFGSEFSAPHYAVVLSKEDSKNKNTVTVVPLTSKKGIDNLKLKESISKQLGTAQAFLTHEYLNTTQSDLLIEAQELMTNYLFFSPYNAEIPEDFPNRNYFFETYDKAMDRFEQIKSIFEKDREIIDNSKKQLKKYMNDLDRTTYVKLDAITTIDKNKIFKRKNSFDPLGVLTLSEIELNWISRGITEKFLFDK